MPVGAATCEVPKKNVVHVRVLDPAAKVVQRETLNKINSKAKAHGLMKRNNLVLGLTHSEVETSMSMRLQHTRIGNMNCITIDEVKVRFGHKELDILVPREYAAGTCQYNVVMQHEKEHVRVNREGVRKYAKLMRRELEKVVARFNPRQASNVKAAQKEAKGILQKAMKRVGTKFQKEMKKKHAQIDKPGGPYDAAGMCKKWK
ncbi:MAG: hypothetical protein OQK24_07815 [Magnetovibrio sp.]|nr:hypothetical protein [Magnetovibrio sp.]